MFDSVALNPGVEISIASRGMSKGVAQTDGPQLITKGLVEIGPVQSGVQWKNVTSSVAEGEGSIFANWQRKFGVTQLTLGAALKFQTGISERTDDKALELNGTLSLKWRNLGARANLVFSPNDLGPTKQSVYVEGGPVLNLTDTLRVSSNFGLRRRYGNPDYTTLNAGISKTVGKLTFEARYYRTTKGELGEIYQPRAVVSVRLAL